MKYGFKVRMLTLLAFSFLVACSSNLSPTDTRVAAVTGEPDIVSG